MSSSSSAPAMMRVPQSSYVPYPMSGYEMVDVPDTFSSEVGLSQLISHGLYSSFATVAASPLNVSSIVMKAQYQSPGFFIPPTPTRPAPGRAGPQPDTSVTSPVNYPQLDGLMRALVALVDDSGVLSLWKALVPQTLMALFHSLTQSSAESILNEVFLLDDHVPIESMDHFLPNLGTLFASHALTNLLSAPANTVLTRMVLERPSPKAKYTSFWGSLFTIFREEGIGGLFAGWMPFVLERTIPVTLRTLSSIFFDRYLRLTDASIITSMLAEAVVNLTELAITSPLSTAAVRLQAQQVFKRSRQLSRPYVPLVAISPVPYKSWVDCIVRIPREEGIRSLYRGIESRFFSNIVHTSMMYVSELEIDEISEI
ncbi:hypothetical protein H696_01131 [Fonticula alba]|uniref:Uncharacterized protein n=1 Tax=Fonticula alba TaxID=691883 RepID=A0A058ZCP9_FONAL|nr:hypothetical protein H696_01131 [Fonticula alba]KCV71708.1 hypothetical protein H696_01131 [Fonticula alba]|eukprot:XP_009493286.1 hypothetical protein H696_01131 [Fonticula alba]